MSFALRGAPIIGDKIMKRFLIVLFFFIYSSQSFSTTTVGIFPQTVSAKVFDRATGNFYVGLASGAGANTISKANRPDYGAVSSFQGISTAEPTFNDVAGINFLTLATSTGNLNANLGAVIQPNNGNEPQAVVCLSNNGKVTGISGDLLDASQLPNQNGLPTSGIVGLAANQYFLFPAIKPCGGDFGANCNGGIASVAIDQSTLALTQVPAIPGDGGIKAQELDPTTPAVYINNSPTITPNEVDLYWDDQLQRLYIGLEVTTAGLSSITATCPVGTGTCNTGTSLQCPAGFFPNLASQTCTTCPSGGIYNAILQDCQLCPLGTLFDPSLGYCVTATCPYGQFFNPNPNSLQCITCPTGWTFNSTSFTCAVCSNGGIYDPSIPGCTSCQTGYVFAPGLGECVVQSVSCPSGFSFCPQTQGCVVTISCPAGAIFDPSQSCTTCVMQTVTGGIGNVPQVPFVDAQTTVGQATFLGFNGALGFDASRDEVFNSNPGPQSPPPFRATPSGGRSVVVAQVDGNGAITLNDIAPDSAFTSGDLNDRIVGALDIVPHTLTINKVRVMHASTGPSYLIVVGGDATFGSTNDTVYALPLVDVGDATNPIQGTLADVNSALVNYKFVTPALLNAQMPAATQPAVQVGTGPLDILPSTTISDIDVVGDTVFVSINHSPSIGNDGGILYSQAMFDETGKILRWTPWTKKAFPPFTTTSAALSSSVKFFSVDAVVAKLWVIDNSGVNVLQNAWMNTSSNTNSLLPQLNSNITGAAIGVLDLDQSTRGFLANQARYALFSGGRNVIFTLVSTSTGATVNSSQLITSNFSTPNNFLITSLPSDSCQVTVLEYARQLTGTASNYFFAGTRNGLYVFSDSGNGFDVATMGALNAPPFSNGSWQQAPNIPGSVVDIKTTGNALYVLTTSAMVGSTLYLIPFQTTVAAMFAPSNIFTIAQTLAGSFPNIVLFNGLQIISTMPNGSTEQIVLATNNGLYTSTKPGGVQNATDDASAQWVLLAGTNFYYNGIAKIDNASIPVSSPSTVWPFYIADSFDERTFNRSVWQQLNGTSDAGPFNFVPPFFNSIETTNPAFNTLPLVSYFWSDGARRMGIVANIASSCAPGQLMCLPFDTLEWDIDNPEETILSDPLLNKAVGFYWIKQIGVTGLLMAGTDKGVLALA
jgi:hypothetical protein